MGPVVIQTHEFFFVLVFDGYDLASYQKSVHQNIESLTSYGSLKMCVFPFSLFRGKIEGINNSHFRVNNKNKPSKSQLYP